MTAKTDRIAQQVARIYNWLDQCLAQSADDSEQCAACGRCCDFDAFDHRLFVTSPEIVYFEHHLQPSRRKPMPGGICPHKTAGKCSVYPHRFAGCRIFCCKTDPALQSRLSEQVSRKFKELCIQFKIPYRYCDLKTALNQISSDRSAVESCPADPAD